MDAGFDTNCHGTTFADGQYWVNNDQVPAIVKGDAYSEQTVATAKEGDKVVYKEGDDSAHSMTVTKTDGTAQGMMIYGQGGVEVTNHTDKATEAWAHATSAQILRKETSNKVVSKEQIQELAKTIPKINYMTKIFKIIPFLLLLIFSSKTSWGLGFTTMVHVIMTQHLADG